MPRTQSAGELGSNQRRTVPKKCRKLASYPAGRRQEEEPTSHLWARVSVSFRIRGVPTELPDHGRVSARRAVADVFRADAVEQWETTSDKAIIGLELQRQRAHDRIQAHWVSERALQLGHLAATAGRMRP